MEFTVLRCWPSAEFTEESQQAEEAAQRTGGDHIYWKQLLLEAGLEAIADGAVELQFRDMGAAGLTCSTTEMACRAAALESKSIWRKCHSGESGMTPYEIMLSESQESMLLVAEDGREQGSRVLDVVQEMGTRPPSLLAK